MFSPGLLLLPAIENAIFQEDFYEKYTFLTLDPDCFEIVIILLTKKIALHLQITIIEVRVLDPQRLV